MIDRYLELGFTDAEAEIIVKLEDREIEGLRGFQYWVSRYDLIKSDISSVEKVRKEIKNL